MSVFCSTFGTHRWNPTAVCSTGSWSTTSPVLVIATKADKIGKNARRTQIAAMQKALGVPELTILPYASPKNEGRSELLDVMKEYLVE